MTEQRQTMLSNYFGHSALELESALQNQLNILNSPEKANIQVQLDVQTTLVQQFAAAKDHTKLARAAEDYLYLSKSLVEAEARKTRAQCLVDKMRAVMAHPQYEQDCRAEMAFKEMEAKAKVAAGRIEQEEALLAQDFYGQFKSQYDAVVPEEACMWLSGLGAGKPQLRAGAWFACSASAFSDRNFADPPCWPALAVMESTDDHMWIIVRNWDGNDSALHRVHTACLYALSANWNART